MAIKEWISIISTVITAFAAIISLIYAQKGINVSNKQFLFDRRLKLYQTLLPNHAKASGDALDKQLEEIRNKGHYYESVEEMKRALESSEWIELVMQMKKNLTLG